MQASIGTHKLQNPVRGIYQTPLYILEKKWEQKQLGIYE